MAIILYFLLQLYPIHHYNYILFPVTVYDSEEIITYEEVQLYHPKPEFPRPVVLVGK